MFPSRRSLYPRKTLPRAFCASSVLFSKALLRQANRRSVPYDIRESRIMEQQLILRKAWSGSGLTKEGNALVSGAAVGISSKRNFIQVTKLPLYRSGCYT
jgi:hypothetical protein